VTAFNETQVHEALDSAWSLEGEILKTRYPNFWHYYNRIDGVRLDLTDSQFTRPGARFNAPESYDDEVSSLAEAMDGIAQKEFDTLKKALLHHLDLHTPG